MAYQICKRCGKMFMQNGNKYCEICLTKNEKEFDLIVNYIRKQANATVLDIITETGVSLKSINCLVEDGGISYAENKLNIEDNDKDSTIDDRMSLKRNKFHITR